MSTEMGIEGGGRGESHAVQSGERHAVQFYEDDAFAVDSVARFVTDGLEAGEAAVVVATGSHRGALKQRLQARGFDVQALEAAGRYVAVDAQAMLSTLLIEGWPDEERFTLNVGAAIERARSSTALGRVRAFGEMVALLWADGHREAAIRLEDLWNDLAASRPVSVLCAYPLGGFASAADASAFSEICARHGAVLPAESFSANGEPERRDRTIAELQQKALALEAEIAAKRRLADGLAAADRLKDEFLATLAHELRNPLAPIAMALKLVRSGSKSSERYLDIIERQTENLSRLVDDLLDVSRITQGRIALRREPTDLAAAVSRARDATQALIDQRGHTLATALPDEPVRLLADPLRLEQILVNLLTNAAKYTPPGGSVEVSAAVVDGHAELRVRDSGVGIPAELLHRVFDLFQQAERTIDRSQGGLGVGLTVARKLVEMHGGTIEARSDGAGRGSEFVVRLPLGAAPDASRDAERGLPRPPAAARTLRVMVVDDNGDAREVLAELLRRRGEDVRSASDGHEALRLAADFDPELVLLDLGMPDMNGFELAHRLHDRGSRALLVAVSGYGQERDRRLTAEAGFWGHLVKPVGVDALTRVIADVDAELRRSDADASAPAA